ncbi:hypothetical protein ABZ622_28790 [Streptomyces sp. NPDC007164]|uniref:hypothetical protein n=1 Tax=Streptomyces sp. NPDC007164 TaxID=3156918 RepID=UPI0033D0B986
MPLHAGNRPVRSGRDVASAEHDAPRVEHRRLGGIVHGFHSVGHLSPAATGATAWNHTARERLIG